MNALRLPSLFLLFFLAQWLVMEPLVLMDGRAYGKLFLLFLLLLPMHLPMWSQYLIAFGLGLSMDLLHPPLGGHTFVCVLLMALRGRWAVFVSPAIAVGPRGELDLPRQPLSWHLRYLPPLILFYEIVYALLVNYALNGRVVSEILLSFLYTTLAVLLLLPVFYRRSSPAR